MPEYRSERREAKRRNARKMGVSGRSVFLLRELSARPKKRRWLKGLDSHETMKPHKEDPSGPDQP